MDHEEQSRKNQLFGAAYFYGSYSAGDTQELVVFYGTDEAEDFLDQNVRPEFRDYVMALESRKESLDDFVLAKDEGILEDFFYYSRINLFSIDDIEYHAEDKFDIDHFRTEQECIDAIRNRIEKYFDDLMDQYGKRVDVKDISKQSKPRNQPDHQIRGKSAHMIIKAPTYRDIHPENLRQYILDHFIDPMGVAFWIDDDLEAMSSIEEDLIIFSYGSPFIRVVHEMVHEFKHGLAFNNEDYLHLFLREIEAVNLGSYRRAAGYRHQRTYFEAEKAFWID
ncbi:MAG: hypothetical protein ABII01_06025 [Candidatus Woesearchaeota archaeon]